MCVVARDVQGFRLWNAKPVTGFEKNAKAVHPNVSAAHLSRKLTVLAEVALALAGAGLTEQVHWKV